MKNLLFVLSIAILTAGCSSGTTVADLPSNVTNAFRGTFQNNPGTQSGGVTLDIQDVNGTVSGNIIFASDEDNCLRNSTVTGSSTGFNLSLSADQTAQRFSVTITERGPDEVTGEGDNQTTSPGPLISEITFLTTGGVQGTVVTTLGNGNVVTRETSAPEQTDGTLNMQLTISNNGNSLSGTYTTTGNVCSNNSGAGTMSFSR